MPLIMQITVILLSQKYIRRQSFWTNQKKNNNYDVMSNTKEFQGEEIEERLQIGGSLESWFNF